MSEKTQLKEAVRGALAFGTVASLAGAGAALAQTAAPASSTAPSATQLSQITVTGSHIPQTSIATAQPIVTVTRQDIENSGYTNLGQILQHLPAVASSFNNHSGNLFIGPYNPSTGFFNLNLYNLGSQRVLILVNGHRWIPSLSGSVNLSTLPTSMVSRVEVLLDGASAIYGSDAISGVVNIITVKNYNGARASAYFGEYDASDDGGGWDGRTQHYTGQFGISNDRGSLLLNVSYRHESAIRLRDRTNTAVPQPGYPVSLTGTAYNPNGYFLLKGDNLGSCPSYPNPPGACVGGPNGLHPFTPADRVNFQKYGYYSIPGDDGSAYVQGHYDLTSNVTFQSSLVYDHHHSFSHASPSPLALGYAGFYTDANGLPIGISANNPYNPFGVDLIPAYSFSSPVASAWCAAYGAGPNGGCTANSDLLVEGLLFTPDLGYRTQDYNSTSFYYQGGFKGYFQLAGNQWTWDANYVFARNRVTNELGGVQYIPNLVQALGPNCGPKYGNDCVPLDTFGTAKSQPEKYAKAIKNYLNVSPINKAGVTERIYTADVAGNFFNGWYAGPWGAAAGYQYLETDGFYHPDPVISTGKTTSNIFQPTSGRVGQNAEYVELKVPFAHDLPGAKALSLDIANRWTQFHVQGQTGENYEHSSTGRVNFKWQPVESLLVRGAWSQSFREPSVSELFAGQAQSFNTFRDPCVVVHKQGAPFDPNPPPPSDTVNCPNPAPTGVSQLVGNVERLSGGNAKLKPERAITRNVGVVWSPTFAPGLDLSLDYYKVELVQSIGLLSPQLLLDGCYLQNIPSDCARIARRKQNLFSINSSLINTGSTKTEGYTAHIGYKFPSTPVGEFRLDYKASFVKTFVRCRVVAGPTGAPESKCRDYAGSLSEPLPKHRMTLDLSWNNGPWAASYRALLIGQQWERCPAKTSPIYASCSNPEKYVNGDQHLGQVGQNHIGTSIYQDVQGSYTVNAWNTTFTLGVQNVFDKPVPISIYYANPLGFYYPIPGRFFYGRVTVNF